MLDQARAHNLLARIARLGGKVDDALGHLDRVDGLLKGQSAMESAWALRERALCLLVGTDVGAAEKRLSPVKWLKFTTAILG